MSFSGTERDPAIGFCVGGNNDTGSVDELLDAGRGGSGWSPRWRRCSW
ncbi:hypothetical protein OHA72_52030 [Dactylosporangium sp. NBC_01737]|nr:hypothetical protein OHA72_52030 [Dactylosporangium sp. NBC_01737]